MRTYKNTKYSLSNHFSRSSKNFFFCERSWLEKYILQDARISKRSQQFTFFFFFSYLNKLFLSKSKLRSFCLFSRKKRAVSKYFFWYGRHALASFLKSGRISGFKKC